MNPLIFLLLELVLFEQRGYQQPDVARPATKWWNAQGNDVLILVIEVFAEFAAIDHAFEILVIAAIRRNVDGNALVASQLFGRFFPEGRARVWVEDARACRRFRPGGVDSPALASG